MENVRIPWKDWKVVKRLGKGSYGTVYEIERTMGSHVEKAAMKVIPIPPSHQIIEDAYNEGYDDESVLKICKSFYDDTLSEYKMMQSLKGHKNIVSCEDIASLPAINSIGWEVYIRMELLTPFLEFKSSPEFNQNEIIKLGKDLCQALILCENNNIVHRDIKPSNIFVDDKGNYKLGDFGVARTLDHSTNATRVGTERFMAPEVINRKPYDKSVDIYSLGLVLYWLLNGRRMPFLSPNRVPTAEEQEKAYYRRITGENLWLPQNGSLPLRKAVLKACSFDRTARYQSAHEMLDALNEVEVLLNQKANKTDNHTSNSAFGDLNEDKTVGNSWDSEDATVGVNFGKKTYDNRSDHYSSLHDDKTVGPGWGENKAKDYDLNKEFDEIFGNAQSAYRVQSQDTKHNAKKGKANRKPIKESAKSLLKNFIILFVILPIGLIVWVNISDKIDSKLLSSSESTETTTETIQSAETKGFQKDSEGNWAWFVNGEVDDFCNGVVKNTDNGEMFYVEDGYVNWDVTSVAPLINSNVWYYVEKGVVDTSKSGKLEFEGGGSCYVNNGIVEYGEFVTDKGITIKISDGKQVN